jgi:hypothetical protein
MLCSDESFDHQRHLQHQLRSNHSEHTNAASVQSSVTTQEQAVLDGHFHDRSLHCQFTACLQMPLAD